MRYIAVHFYSYRFFVLLFCSFLRLICCSRSTFMTNQYANTTYTAYCPNPLQYPCYPTS